MQLFLKIFLFIFAMITAVGEVKSSTVAEKLIHLAADNASIGDIENALSSKNFEYQKDASVEGGFMVDTEKQYKGWAAMQIFSPEIVGEILFMSLGTGSSAERVTEKTVSKTTTVAAQTAKTGTQTVYRAVNAVEKASINSSKNFLLKEGGTEVKYFAKTIEDAHWYGSKLYPGGYSIIQGTVNSSVNAGMYWFPYVDIGAYAFPKTILPFIKPIIP